MKLRILNETGHTELEVTSAEMIEQIADHPTHWVYVDGDMVQTGGTTLQSSKINTSGTYELTLIVLDDDGATSTIAFTIEVPQDVVSGSEGMLGGNLFTIALVTIIVLAGFLMARMGATEQETSLPKWQRKKD